MQKSIRIIALIIIVFTLIPFGAQALQLVPGGQLIGLELCSDTVTVAAFDKTESIAQKAGMQIGDTITHIDDTAISCAADIRWALNHSQGTVKIRFTRKGQPMRLTLAPTITTEGPRIGVYLKQGITGVGTVTYYDPDNGSFGALGHSVNDSAGKLLKTTGGTAYNAAVLSIRKGKCGKPGQLMGTMDTDQVWGSLGKNTQQGVFGNTTIPLDSKPLEIASASQVHTGNAVIRSTLDEEGVQEYSVKILKIYPKGRSGGRNMLIKVTDKKLLETTGGIVQGMSGSPIIQDGKLIGAVTHVLVNDPTSGYGIFIENMLDAAA